MRQVHDSTRIAELSGLGWPDDQLAALLDMQFQARERSLPETADDEIVEVDGVPAGRIITDGTGPALRLIDLALLPDLRNRGVGGQLLGQLCARADAEGRPIDLCVLVGSPATRLYQRWGFALGAREGMHDRMRRLPGAGQ